MDSAREPTTWRAYLDLPKAVHLLCLGTLVNRAGSFLLPFLALYVQGTRGLSVEVATRAVGAFGLGGIVASLVGGYLADRIGRRVVMLMALTGGAGVLAIFGGLRSPWAILGAVFVFSLLSEMYRPAAGAMIADLVPPARRPHAFGLMYVAINLGFTIGALIGGVVARYSYQWLFWGDALTTCLYVGIILLWIRETLPGRRAASGAEPVPGPDAAPSPEPAPAPANAFIRMARDRVFVVYCVATFLAGSVFIQLFSSFPLHTSAHGLGTDAYGAIIAINGVMIVLLQLPVTTVVTRFARAPVLALSAAITAVGFGVLPYAIDVPSLVLLMVVWTVAELMQSPLTQAVVSDLAPADLRGRYLGVLSLCFALAIGIGSPLGGWALDRFGPVPMWTGCMVTGLCGATLYLALGRRIRAVSC